MHIYFRTDASPFIGTGHVMRCLTLADALKSAGSTCIFISRELPKYLSDLIRQRGHEVINLSISPTKEQGIKANHSSLYRYDWQADAEETIKAINHLPIDWMIIDHYELDARWEHILRRICNHIMVIDDLANRSHDCELLLDQGLHNNPNNRYKYLVPEHCKLLLGPRHVLLQPAFENLPPYRHTGYVNNVLAFFGGNDRNNQTGSAIQALKNFPQLKAKVVLGINNPNKDSAYSEAYYSSNISVVETCADMHSAMAEADLGLGVCGMAAWERCAMGLPTIVSIIADNQRDDTTALHQLGAVENIGEASEVTAADWTSAISRALTEPSRITRMSEICLKVVEGHKENLRLLIDDLRKYDY